MLHDSGIGVSLARRGGGFDQCHPRFLATARRGREEGRRIFINCKFECINANKRYSIWQFRKNSNEDILRTIAIFRYLNPTAYIRMAAGRTYFSDGGTKIFQAGANATITGDMLTTVGNNTQQDKIMLTKLGFNIQK